MAQVLVTLDLVHWVIAFRTIAYPLRLLRPQHDYLNVNQYRNIVMTSQSPHLVNEAVSVS